MKQCGEAEWASVESDKCIVTETFQCVHCAMHVLVRTGSGKKRGWCMNCNGATCGQEKCDPCIHWKKKLDLIESGQADMSLISTGVCDNLPVTVNVPADVPCAEKSAGGVIIGKE